MVNNGFINFNPRSMFLKEFAIKSFKQFVNLDNKTVPNFRLTDSLEAIFKNIFC